MSSIYFLDVAGRCYLEHYVNPDLIPNIPASVTLTPLDRRS